MNEKMIVRFSGAVLSLVTAGLKAEGFEVKAESTDYEFGLHISSGRSSMKMSLSTLSSPPTVNEIVAAAKHWLELTREVEREQG